MAKGTRRRRAETGVDGVDGSNGGDLSNVQTTAGVVAAGEIGEPRPDFPEVPEGSGLRENFVLQQPTDRSKVQSRNPENAAERTGDIPEPNVRVSPLGHPNRTIIEEATAEHHAPANRPFGSQPQNLNTETGLVEPMDPEERRTGVAAE